MNFREIEALARQIEENVKQSRELTDQETLRYIRDHQDQIVAELVRNGRARVLTSLGEFSLTLDDLKASAA